MPCRLLTEAGHRGDFVERGLPGEGGEVIAGDTPGMRADRARAEQDTDSFGSQGTDAPLERRSRGETVADTGHDDDRDSQDRNV